MGVYLNEDRMVAVCMCVLKKYLLYKCPALQP